MGLAWGAVLVMAYGATAQAAPKAAPAGSAGSAAATAAAPSSVPAAGGAPGAATAGPVVPDAPPAPDAGVAAPETAPPPAPPVADAGAKDDEDAEEEEQPRKKRKHRRGARVLRAEPIDDEEENAPEEPAPLADPWRLVGPHFLLGVERITNVLSWSTKQTVELSNFNTFGPTTIELERSGTDVSFLGSGGPSTNVFGIPRLTLDGMFGNGLTLGGSISYMTVSGKHETVSGNANKSNVDDPTSSVFIFAPRVGVVIAASPTVGIWLRGGISRISASTDSQSVDNSGQPLGGTVTTTLTLVDVTLDPQLIITPVPHVGITLGALLDIGASGTLEQTGSTSSMDVTASSYGITGGLVAIF
jgi:hypothetical protein